MKVRILIKEKLLLNVMIKQNVCKDTAKFPYLHLVILHHLWGLHHMFISFSTFFPYKYIYHLISIVITQARKNSHSKTNILGGKPAVVSWYPVLIQTFFDAADGWTRWVCLGLCEEPTLTKLSTASLTVCTGRARSGMAFPSSASSWRITSRDTYTWRKHKTLLVVDQIYTNTQNLIKIKLPIDIYIGQKNQKAMSRPNRAS